ncbi:hypothetical protein Q7C36_011370 [Tachysurus vachellii]|uniref:Uncharacterized protein n=1 Tax=Tachysurus vachellii TaxID=175792 RepID=A0AA88MQM9_TACVA|nr:hypothetical protein Q7C36_011370 [Tachysurus vachellii]
MKLAGRVMGLLEMMNEADRASEAHIRWDNYAKLPGWNVSLFSSRSSALHSLDVIDRLRLLWLGGCWCFRCQGSCVCVCVCVKRQYMLRVKAPHFPKLRVLHGVCSPHFLT